MAQQPADVVAARGGAVSAVGSDGLGVNHTTRRFPRSTREAFEVERYPALTGPYSRPSFSSVFWRFAALLCLFAAIGALIGCGF